MAEGWQMDLVQKAAYVVLALIFLGVTKLLFDLFDKGRSNPEQDRKTNLALVLRNGGMMAAIALALSGAFQGQSQGFMNDMQSILMDGALALAFVLIAFRINDWVMMRGISTVEEIQKGNLAVGVMELGSLVATGLIIRGSLVGQGPLTSTLVSFLLAQLALVIIFKIYEALTAYDDIEQIQAGNSLCAVLFAGLFVSLAIVLSAGIAGNFTGWSDMFIYFGVDAALGIVLLSLLSLVVERGLLRIDLTTEVVQVKNPAPVAMIVVSQLTFAVIIAAAL